MSKLPTTSVQSNEVSYSLHSLGWKAFQGLCITIVSEIWGQTVQSFSDSRDGGRDGAFQGVWKTKDEEVFTGAFTIQCKFTSKPNGKLTLASLSEELEKAKRLAAKGLAENYFLFTNSKVSGVVEEEIKSKFESMQGLKRCSVFGGERISQLIRESPRLRMLVPRVYGLGDLGEIMDERAYGQAREILTALGDDLNKFVITDAYKKSAQALIEHGFVLLLGEAMCGKSTIAAALSMGALDRWKCNTIKVIDAEDFVRHSNPNNSGQLFWVDDAFGSTQVDFNTVTQWNRALPHMHAVINRGAKVIFTSRDYIYKSARRLLKETAFPLLKESQVVIQVEKLTKDEKEQILYNHIRLGKQKIEFKQKVKPFLPAVSAHVGFSPEIARRLGDPTFTKNLWVSEYGLNDFVAKPMDLLCDIIRSLDSESRAALALIFIRDGILSSPINIEEGEERFIELLGGTINGIRQSLNSMEESLVNYQTLKEGKNIWTFKHPTIRDAFATLIAEDKELMDIYLAGTPIERVFREVSCGLVELEGVKVVIPSNRYDAIISRIGKIDTTKSDKRDTLNYFLARRCSKEFLEVFVIENSDFINNLRVYSYLYAVSDINVITRLFDFGLLPEAKRVQVIEKIKELAFETPDAGFLRKDIKALFSESELRDVMASVKTNLLSELENEIDNWRSQYRYHSDEEPEGHFGELVDALSTYKDELAEDEESKEKITTALGLIEKVVAELNAEKPSKADEENDDFGEKTQKKSDENDRSIFDDVDH